MWHRGPWPSFLEEENNPELFGIEAFQVTLVTARNTYWGQQGRARGQNTEKEPGKASRCRACLVHTSLWRR